MRVLIVEDLKVMRRVIANSIRDLGIDEIFESEDGIDALSLLQDEIVDLVITDWLMPNMDGFDLVRDMRNDERLEDIPVLMITSVDDKQSVVKALRAGTNDYIAKPFKPEILKEKVAKLLNIMVS